MARWADRWRSYWDDDPPRSTSAVDAVAVVLLDLMTDGVDRRVVRQRVSADGARFVNSVMALSFGAAAPHSHPDWVTIDCHRATADSGRLVIALGWGYRFAVVDLGIASDAEGPTEPAPDEGFPDLVARFRTARAVDVVAVRPGPGGPPLHAGPGRRRRLLGWDDVLPVLRTSFPDEARSVMLADFLAAHVARHAAPPDDVRPAAPSEPAYAACSDRTALVDAIVELARRHCDHDAALDVRFAGAAHAASIAGAANARLGRPWVTVWNSAPGSGAARTAAGRETGCELRLRRAPVRPWSTVPSRDDGPMRVHLIDGTYELFRQHYGTIARHETPPPYAATIGVLTSTLQLLREGATHIGVASDHIIESFRNDLWPGYKTSAGMDPELLAQIPIVEEALDAMGVTVWAMVEHEADDALASAARVAAADPRVEQVLIVTPDKDLGQCVRGTRVVQFDRRKGEILDEAGVTAKFGVGPASVADWLALVGDSADGYPGLPGWGAKTASAVLARYGTIAAIPDEPGKWDVAGLRGVPKLAATLADQRALAELFVRVATVVDDLDVGAVDDWAWRGPTERFAAIAEQLGAGELVGRAMALTR